MPIDEKTSTTLLERVTASEPEAWARLVDLYGPIVYQRCRKAGLQEVDADEVFQEVFLTVSRSIGRFRRDRPGDSFRGWFSTITNTRILDFHRKQGRQVQAKGGSTAQVRLAQLPESTGDTSITDLPLGEDGGLLRRALELVRPRVSEQTWQACWRLLADDQRVADVAEELGMTPRSVYDAKYRVMRMVREEFGDLIE
ncbi:MAG: sigma-70 family RNA polymerase sigma factor [Planctomycetes bacterium]|nr:sigma-70 family RNA polymerase sigma factor [Planctomycetota bacterium]MBL7039346.1 sigma-70 family RNA polymerase sigma factor [Pirellulaceae bacterium]